MWILADYCEWIGKDPSVHLNLKRMGISAVVRNDFDYAVRALKRTWDRRRDEVIYVVDTEPTKHRKPKKTVPKYKTLNEILGLNKDGAKPERLTAAEQALEDKLAKDFAAGAIDWSAYE